MKTSITTATVATVLLTGTLIAQAHPHRQNQPQPRRGQNMTETRRGRPDMQQERNRRQTPALNQQRNECVCQRKGPANRQQMNGKRSSGQRGKNQQHAHMERRPRNQSQQGQSPRADRRDAQRPNNKDVQKRREAMLKRFDTDKDGQLSNEERQAVRETLQERRRGIPGQAPERREPPSGE